MAVNSAPGSSGAQSVHVSKTWESPSRAAYSPKQFAALFGRHPSWAYRLLYRGKLRALTDLGDILIPVSELERVLSSAAPYDPKPRTRNLAESGATTGGDA